MDAWEPAIAVICVFNPVIVSNQGRKKPKFSGYPVSKIIMTNVSAKECIPTPPFLALKQIVGSGYQKVCSLLVLVFKGLVGCNIFSND